MRLFSSILMAIVVVFGLFSFMQYLITRSDLEVTKTEPLHVTHFIDTRIIDSRSIRQPEPEARGLTQDVPQIQEPPPPPRREPKPAIASSLEVEPMPIKDMPDISPPLQIMGEPVLRDLAVEEPVQHEPVAEVDLTINELVPLVTVTPRYPRKAVVEKIEGWVKLEFTVTRSGAVTDVTVVEAHPMGVFDQAATRAMLKSTFKPRLVNGKPVAQRASRVVEFILTD